MARNNPVFQVLVPTANTAALSVGQPITALAPGQIGFFNENTNLSINVATPQLMNNFYIAVGVDSNGDGTTDDVAKSAGQYIQKKFATNLTARCYLAPRAAIWDITDFKASCDDTYAIRFNVATAAGRTMYGPNNPLKTFVVQSGCCGPCATCGTGNASEVALKFVNDINADDEKLFKADLLDYTTTPGTPVIVPVSGYAAWVAANSHLDADGNTVYDHGLGIRITTLPEKIYATIMGGLNAKYDFPRGVVLNIALIDGFECTGKVTSIQTMLFEQGSGYDVQQMEYDCAGHNGAGNYRQSELTGFITGKNAVSVASGKYVLFTLTNDFESNGGFEDFRANLETTIAVPCGNATALTSIAAMFDGIFAGMFEPMAALVASCDCTGANGEIAALNDASNDGIAVFQ